VPKQLALHLHNDTREILEAAFALDDEAKQQFEDWQRQQALKRRNDPDQIVYKTYQPSRQQPQQESTSMDDATAAKWNAWAEDHVRRQLQPAFDGAADATGQMLRALEKQLRDEITSLRCELDLVRAIANGTVTPLKGDRGAA
jgi:hypothetical protein